MKLLRTCVSLAVLLSMIGAPAFASEVVTVESVEATAEDTVMVMTATDLALADGEVTGDVKLFQDVNVVSATTDAEDATKLTLALGSDLEANTTYNLLSVFGVDGGIDFSLGDEVVGAELANTTLQSGEQGIQKVVVTTANSMDVYFVSAVEGDEFEFRLLQELEIMSMGASDMDANMLQITTEPMATARSFILMLISVSVNAEEVYSFDAGVYDFVTPNVFETVVEETMAPDIMMDETDAPDTMIEDMLITEDLNAAPEAMTEEGTDTLDETAVTEEQDVEVVAQNAEATPETGAPTTVLLILTMIILGFFIFRKRLLQS